jgi:heme exporter protein A
MQLVGSDLICVRGGRQVFAGISFAVRAGEALVISGPNGAGKTSLLRMVAGLLRIEAGHIELVGGEPDRTIAEQAHFLGYQDALKPSLSVAENLRFWTRYLGEGGPAGQLQTTPSPSAGSGMALGERDEPKAVVLALAAVGLDQLADLPAGYLSAGQRRRLSIARLLAIKRPIWLLDEPTAALDTAAQARLAELMRLHVSGGGLILAATHGPLGIDANHELGLAPPS